ncbi:MAG: 4Fe-4S dicluster domain-containing protein [Peptococcaceae bacterium]
MAGHKDVNETVKIRRRVLTEVARLALHDNLAEGIDDLPEYLLSMGNQRYRCCEYKEKAIYTERIKLALGLRQKKAYKKRRLSELLPIALSFPDLENNQINIIDIACEGCPINKFFVTNACQNCLAHACQNACPRDAITIVQKQAYIDQNKCVECGLCKKSCPYSAIVEINRPCEASCQINAIKANTDRKAVIDYEKCVECGACVMGCPYAAISNPSQILRVINYLKTEKVIAVLAPAFIGQLGQRDNPGPIIKALEMLGFSKVVEAAMGADIVSLEESAEFLAKVPGRLDFMTTSCCPAFVNLVKKHYPDLEKNISSTVSPMLAAAKYLKQITPRARIVFIGPCIAKKTEAWQNKIIDAVLTFEELTAMFVAAGINVGEVESDNIKVNSNISGSARGFAQAGGVAKAVEKALDGENVVWKPLSAQGLNECSEILNELTKGRLNYNFLEGMACTGGCLGGPGTIIDGKMTKRYLQTFSQNCQAQSPLDNGEAEEIRRNLGTNLHKSR